jgi:hypothetical protein
MLRIEIGNKQKLFFFLPIKNRITMNATKVTVPIEFTKDDVLVFMEDLSGSFSKEEKVRALRAVLGLNNLADIAQICSEIISLK